MKKIFLISLGILLIGGAFFVEKDGAGLRSITDDAVHNHYYITSATASSTATTVIKSGYGVFGSITFTSSSPATTYPQITIYDATSTTPTSSAEKIAQFGLNPTTGETYTFDVGFGNGLVIEVPTGFNGKATISYR